MRVLFQLTRGNSSGAVRIKAETVHRREIHSGLGCTFFGVLEFGQHLNATQKLTVVFIFYFFLFQRLIKFQTKHTHNGHNLTLSTVLFYERLSKN